MIVFQNWRDHAFNYGPHNCPNYRLASYLYFLVNFVTFVADYFILTNANNDIVTWPSSPSSSWRSSLPLPSPTLVVLLSVIFVILCPSPTSVLLLNFLFTKCGNPTKIWRWQLKRKETWSRTRPSNSPRPPQQSRQGRVAQENITTSTVATFWKVTGFVFLIMNHHAALVPRYQLTGGGPRIWGRERYPVWKYLRISRPRTRLECRLKFPGVRPADSQCDFDRSEDGGTEAANDDQPLY